MHLHTTSRSQKKRHVSRLDHHYRLFLMDARCSSISSWCGIKNG
jgi:hypothetical protein